MKLILTILLFLSSYSLLLAEENSQEVDLKQYDVEIIIFEDTHARYINSQSWGQQSADSLMPENKGEIIENLDDMSLNDIIATDFKTRSPSILEKDYKRLNTSSDFEVLFYGAWRQAGLNKSKAFEIDIRELNNVHNTGSVNRITGKFKLILARYLHLYNQLSYNRLTTVASEKAVTTTEPTNPVLIEKTVVYQMESHRRMRSKELHYIDHPLVGLLVQINPVENVKKVAGSQ